MNNNKKRARRSSKPVTIEQLEEIDNNLEDILTREYKIVLPLSKIGVIIKQPTIEDEETIIGSAPYIADKQIKIVNFS